MKIKENYFIKTETKIHIHIKSKSSYFNFVEINNEVTKKIYKNQNHIFLILLRLKTYLNYFCFIYLNNIYPYAVKRRFI